MQRLIRGTAPVALMLLLAACGGGDGGKQTTSAAGPTTTTPTTVPPAAQGGVVDAAVLSQRCANYASYAGTVGLAMAAAMDPKVAAQLEELKAKMNLDEAPEEIRDDFKVVTDYARGLGEVLARYPMTAGQYDAAGMAALGAYTQSVDQAGMTAASENINKWVQANCKS
jgi:hypothetical protein